MTQEFQPLQCKKCGRGDFYNIQPGEKRGRWEYIDQFNQVQAFESPFDVPHWTICPATTKGHEQRRKLEAEMADFIKREFQKREEIVLQKTPMHPPDQTRLASEHLTPLDREISAKLNVMELILDDIKRLMAQKAQSDI